MFSVRESAYAGSFYPDDAEELQSMVNGFIADVEPQVERPQALVVPHAGYVYSGAIAGQAYAQLAARREQIRRVILLGPTHHVPFEGLALTPKEAYTTPLGEIRIDRVAEMKIEKMEPVQSLEIVHRMEHSLEVQLPFLQTVLGDFRLLPIVVGNESFVEDVADVLNELWDDEENLIVVSTDLSHFHDYDEATKIDADTTRIIENMSEDLQPQQACGCRPLNGLMMVAQERGLKVTTLATANSGDTGGPKDRVVGYGAFAFS